MQSHTQTPPGSRPAALCPGQKPLTSAARLPAGGLMMYLHAAYYPGFPFFLYISLFN
jgi:hypothetical protein